MTQMSLYMDRLILTERDYERINLKQGHFSSRSCSIRAKTLIVIKFKYNIIICTQQNKMF